MERKLFKGGNYMRKYSSLNSLEILMCELLVASRVMSLKKISRHLLTYPVLQLHCANLTLLTSFAVTAIF